ncbi:MAG TPA: CotH kinase family protein [Thermoanaerobaculia bacterium]|nr:CotH kinase family protein [Thermoanaerobaculia bacterium]
MNIRLALCTLLFASSIFADAAVDAMFDRARLHNVQITMSDADWATLRANYQQNTNYDATLTIDGERITNCTIRSRGSGTRNGIKPGLRVDFNRKIKSQTFHGFKILVLDNMYNDASFLHEQLAFAVFEEKGIRVPRESFTRLTVNGQYWGLYAIVEPIDQIFVTTHVDAGGGNLFEYNAPAAATPDQLQVWDFALSRGGAVANYVPSPFEPKTNEDTLDGSALVSFLRTISESPDATFVEDVSAFVDPEVMLTYYAVEVATAEADGLTGSFGPNNFYLYQLQGTQRFLFIPWDHDFNFVRGNHSAYYGAERNILLSRLLASPALGTFYRDTLQSILTQYMNPGWMAPRIDAFVALIRPSVLEDPKRRPEDFDAAVAYVRQVIADRGHSIETQLNPTRRRPARH